MTNYERRRREIARREFEHRRHNGQIPMQRNFDTWYATDFLTDILLMNMVINEIGPEETYQEPGERNEQIEPEEPIPAEREENNYLEQEGGSSYDDNSSDSGSDSSFSE